MKLPSQTYWCWSILEDHCYTAATCHFQQQPNATCDATLVVMWERKTLRSVLLGTSGKVAISCHSKVAICCHKFLCGTIKAALPFCISELPAQISRGAMCTPMTPGHSAKAAKVAEGWLRGAAWQAACQTCDRKATYGELNKKMFYLPLLGCLVTFPHQSVQHQQLCMLCAGR